MQTIMGPFIGSNKEFKNYLAGLRSGKVVDLESYREKKKIRRCWYSFGPRTA